MKVLPLVILFSLAQLSVRANHFTGAELRYEYTGSNKLYRIYLTLYKTCETGAIDLPTFINVYAESKQNAIIINKNLTRITNDTLQPFCANTLTTCTNLSAQYPGYIAATYTDTITIPVLASDWLLIFSNSNRNFGITNLAGASGQSFYVDAPLNILNYNNTSAVVPDVPPHVLFVNDSISVPLTAYDKDGDSVGFDFMQPASGTGVLIPYYPGFSLSQPFGAGGLCYIDSKNNMVLKANNVGKYTITLRTIEYRNGAAIAYTLRDFIIICVNAPAGNGLSIPTPVSTKNLVTYSCPGRNNTLTFQYTDAVPTDSVYLQIIPPTLAGWSFNPTVAPGIGGATGTLSWTTPPGVVPSALPFFNINVVAYDNACKTRGKATYVYTVKLRDCLADSVWPGDANSDKIVDLYDPLAIAIAYNDTGSSRPGASINWQAQACNYWDGTILNNIDKKHADCSGDGIVDTADLNAIRTNYGKIHAKGGAQKPTAGGNFSFDHTGIHPNPDSTVSLKILLSSPSGIQGIYGLATNIKVDGLTLAAPPQISYPASWLGNSSNTLSFVKDLSNTTIDWAYARTDKQNTNGNGVLAEVSFKIPGGTPAGTLVTVSFERYKFINKDGDELTGLTASEDTFYVQYPANVSDAALPHMTVKISPNPVATDASLSIYASEKQAVSYAITDIMGRNVAGSTLNINAGENNTPLAVERLEAGMYFIQISSANHPPISLKFIKH